MQTSHHSIHLPQYLRTPIAHLAAFKAYGPDAATFLQSQLTQDISNLSHESYTYAGYCSAKGRLLANFIVWRSQADEFILVCSADVLESIIKRLRMFVLRARCQFEVFDASWALLGGIGGDTLFAQDIKDGQVLAAPNGWMLGLSAAPSLVADGPNLPRQMALIQNKSSPASIHSPDIWRLLDINSGFPWVQAATAEQFVPQMINWEVLNGVNFKKGCYPGQEVVARTQYRGTLKRRMFLMELPVACQAGDEVYTPDHPDQPLGIVVNAAPLQCLNPQAASAYRALVSLKLEALEVAPRVSVGAGSNHPTFELVPCLRPLPYTWDEPVCATEFHPNDLKI